MLRAGPACPPSDKEQVSVLVVSIPHLLPASVIGNFSAAPATARRKSRVWVGRRGAPSRVALTKASTVNREKNYYDIKVDQVPTTLVDDGWGGFESSLPRAIADLTTLPDGSVSTETFLWTLVPYVAATFVRGRDFESRVRWRAQHGDFEREPNRSGINAARTLEYQRVLALTMSSHWTLLKARGKARFVLGDRGIAVAHLGRNGSRPIYYFPLSPQLALRLSLPKPSRPKSLSVGLDYVTIPCVDALDGCVRLVNTVSANGCVNECYASDRAALELLRGLHEHATAEDDLLIGFEGLVPDALLKEGPASLSAYEYDWYRATESLNSNQGGTVEQYWRRLDNYPRSLIRSTDEREVPSAIVDLDVVRYVEINDRLPNRIVDL